MNAYTVGQLSERIAVLTKKLEEDMKASNIESPTLDDHTTSDLSSVDQGAAMELAGLAKQLEHLALGPRQSIGMMALSVSYHTKPSAAQLTNSRYTMHLLWEPLLFLISLASSLPKAR
jgi:hypothetical protein